MLLAFFLLQSLITVYVVNKCKRESDVFSRIYSLTNASRLAPHVMRRVAVCVGPDLMISNTWRADSAEA